MKKLLLLCVLPLAFTIKTLSEITYDYETTKGIVNQLIDSAVPQAKTQPWFEEVKKTNASFIATYYRVLEPVHSPEQEIYNKLKHIEGEKSSLQFIRRITAGLDAHQKQSTLYEQLKQENALKNFITSNDIWTGTFEIIKSGDKTKITLQRQEIFTENNPDTRERVFLANSEPDDSYKIDVYTHGNMHINALFDEATNTGVFLTKHTTISNLPVDVFTDLLKENLIDRSEYIREHIVELIKIAEKTPSEDERKNIEINISHLYSQFKYLEETIDTI